MLVRLHVRERRCGLVERESAIDGQRQLAGFDRRPQVRAHAAVDFADLLDGASAEGDADVVDTAQGVKVEIELTFGAAETPDIDNAAANGGGFHVVVGNAGGDLIDDEIHALAVRRLQDLVGPAGIGGI